MIRFLRQNSAIAFRFADSHKKSVNQHLKLKKSEAINEKLTNSTSLQELESSHRLLYVQFLPAVLFAFPVMYYMGDPSSVLFNNSLNLSQYYLSGILCFNSFFTQSNMGKYYYFLFAVGAANCLSGPYSMVTPVILGLLNLYFPFTDEKYHKFETVEQEARVKTFLRVQGLFYFLVGVLLTLKFYHYEEIRQLEMKLAKFDSENTAFHQAGATAQVV